MMRRVFISLALCVLVWAAPAWAADYYDLKPEQVAPDTWVLRGAQENFDFDNYGAIANTGFIVTEDGVVVIDTGASRLYGDAMRAAIARITDRPIARVYITHAHPDHFLGNNTFEDVPIAALAATRDAIRRIGPDLASNLYDLVGPAMRGTSAVVPNETVAPDTSAVYGSHEIELIATHGHTAGDLMLFDRTTGVLFAGDIAFHDRAATTPNADLDAWQQALAATRALEFDTLVPGHGPVTGDDAPLVQTGDYLRWLRQRLHTAAERGASAAEVMFEALPPRWAALAVEPDEYRRSVSHLYPAIEQAAFEQNTKP